MEGRENNLFSTGENAGSSNLFSAAFRMAVRCQAQEKEMQMCPPRIFEARCLQKVEGESVTGTIKHVLIGEWAMNIECLK